MFDFQSTEAAQETSYLKPGVYAVKITEVKAGEFPQKKSPYLGVTFTTAEGLSITEKFPLSEKALGRLQYLHEAWTNKKLDKVFKSVEEVETYFAKTFVNKKAGARNLVVGGEINGKVTYGSIPYTGFIAGDDSDLELGEFEEGGDNWKKYVRKSNRPTETTGRTSGILNNDDDEENDEKPAKGKTGKTTGKKKDDDDEEDTPW